MYLTYKYVKLPVRYVITVQMCSVIRTFMWEQFHKKITEPWITKVSLKLHFQISITISQHTLDMLWEIFQSILPLYMKPITFQRKGFSCLVSHHSCIYWFLLGETKCVSPYIGRKNKELKCLSSFRVNYFLIYYLMMHRQAIVKRANGVHEWAHRPYQLLSAPYHCWLYKHSRQDERQLPQGSWPVPICA